MRKSATFSMIWVMICAAIFLQGFKRPENNNAKVTTGGQLTFTIRTVTQNGTYAPKNVFVIWIEDANGFVKTRKAMANQRKEYLYTWKTASNYNVVDAITGPTLTSHQTHTVTWNCTDLSGNIVPDGNYIVKVEFTEKHAQGPLYTLSFTKGANAQSITPPDETYFKDIQLDFVPYIADFTSDVSVICQGQTVTFTDLSVGATSWSWIFGEGASPASAITSGPHTVTYLSPGPKTVSLTINGSVTETKQNMISVNPSPTADFSYSGNLYTVEFLNNSINATSFSWDFGDGESSTEINPTHTYSTAGTYSVSLTANYINCSDVIIHDVSVPVVGIRDLSTGIPPLFNFSPNPSAGLVNFRWSESLCESITLTAYNALGKPVEKMFVNNPAEDKNIILDISDQPVGIYFIKIEGKEVEVVQKLILR